MIVKTCTCCLSDLTLAEWLLLPLVGTQRFPGEPVLELRNHRCGSTIAIEMPARPMTDVEICLRADALRAAGDDDGASDVLKGRFEP